MSSTLCIVLRADKLCTGGQLEEALAQYKRSKEFGVDRAEMHIRNVRRLRTLLSRLARLTCLCVQVSAKILGKRMREAEEEDKSATRS